MRVNSLNPGNHSVVEKAYSNELTERRLRVDLFYPSGKGLFGARRCLILIDLVLLEASSIKSQLQLLKSSSFEGV